MAELIDGKLVSQKLREKIKGEVDAFKAEFGITPYAYHLEKRIETAKKIRYVQNIICRLSV